MLPPEMAKNRIITDASTARTLPTALPPLPNRSAIPFRR
jgi:hypothetical protein